MDFDLDETHAELRALAASVLDREADQARIEAHERGGRPYDAGAWKALAQAGLLGACLPPEAGGSGLGPLAMGVILREAGARVAPVPALPGLIAALTVAGHGTDAQRRALAPFGEGEEVLTVAFREAGAGPGDPPAAIARDGRITGRPGIVPYAAEASAILVPALSDGEAALFLVRPGDAQVRQVPTATGEPAAVVTLEDAPGEMVGEPDGAAVAALRLNTLAAVTATTSGVLAGALALTKGHIATRRQFDRVLAEFQAVTMQIADVYIASRALDVAMWTGVWRLGEGLPAERDLAVAAYNAAADAVRALYTCQHLHGGIGLDLTYPLHRYFGLGKHLAQLLGGAQAQLDLIGALV
ncbi:acyl-CoA/acyl-ACP dehydrogenase [Microbispora sp. NEAU-D428]|uniref:acyl-CoA dehydrogenase family protein n=1 Tax=Microbispora sitophila TaxID=2771537 RepID=UPI001867153C|nr:acyl-CoA dehydrogenase family protein [Microbispora sitophila]MBE3007619.1 acyl-CoA/acyl-ACP dehydrogenase [Microbispora sitophila]